jgi:hypothetical protein
VNLRKALKVAGIVAAAYVVIVIAFEVFVVVVGKREAEAGVQPGGDYLVLTTTVRGKRYDTVVAGVVSDGHVYVAANHWPRSWYERVVTNPEVEVTRGDEHMACVAVPVTGAELARIERDYRMPFLIRFLTGFPPRAFLRLDQR